MLSNYSKKIQAVAKRLGIRIGDRVKVLKDDEIFEGVLMPKPEIGDPEALVVKLDNGYNIGVKVGKGTKLERSKKKESEKLVHEVDFELGNEKTGKLRFSDSKPKISLVSTGGTIASKVEYKTGGVTAMENPEELLTNLPELADFVNVSDIVSPFKKQSEDMDYKDWQKMAKAVATELNKDNKGVVVTHGTDTLHYTAAALSFMLKNLNKPVILVGAQRSPDRGSSDAFSNVICAAHAAMSDIAEVSICMHANSSDDFCFLNRGTKVRKMHTSRRDAFRPINEQPLAKIWPDGRFETVNSNYRQRSENKVSADVKFEPKVGILKAYPGSDPSVLEFMIRKRYKGFVIEGTGLGHVPTKANKSWIPAIKKAVKKKIPVVITSQTIHGRISPNVYQNQRILFHETGAISGEDMTTETAYIKLGWILGHTKALEEVKRLMLTNLAGEINPKQGEENYFE